MRACLKTDRTNTSTLVRQTHGGEPFDKLMVVNRRTTKHTFLFPVSTAHPYFQDANMVECILPDISFFATPLDKRIEKSPKEYSLGLLCLYEMSRYPWVGTRTFLAKVQKNRTVNVISVMA